MAHQNRFAFPGFNFVVAKDTLTHEVERGKVENGGKVFVLEMIRPSYLQDIPFVLAQVEDASGKVLWTFQQEKFEGVGRLAKAGDEVVVALVGRGKLGKVERVVPFSKFLSSDHGPTGMIKSIQLKKAAAEFLGLDYFLSTIEDKLSTKLIAAEEEMCAAAEATAREARIAERQRRVEMIMKRGIVTGFTATGRRLFGHPVLESEWPSLPHGSFAIVVDSFNSDGTLGKMIEGFEVQKKGGNPKKLNLAAIVSAKPPAAVEVPKPIRTEVVQRGEEYFEVGIYPTMSHIQAAQKAGLNGGSYVAADAKENGKIAVFSITREKIIPVGKYATL